MGTDGAGAPVPFEGFFEYFRTVTFGALSVKTFGGIEGNRVDVAEQAFDSTSENMSLFGGIVDTFDQRPFEGDAPMGLIYIVAAGFE